MAFPTFDSGFFQVTALSFSPSVVAIGETATMSITIKNVSGKSITKCYVDQDGRYPSTNYQYGGSFPSQFLYGGGGSSGWDLKTISWGNNVSHTFTGTVSFKEGYYHLDTTNYVLDPTQTYIHIGVVTNATFSNGGNYDNLFIRPDGSYLRILSRRDNPKLTLEIERTPNDEATAVKTTAKLTADVASSVLTAHGYTIKLTATNAHNPALPTDSAVAFNATVANLITGITNSTSAISASFSAATDWYEESIKLNDYQLFESDIAEIRALSNFALLRATETWQRAGAWYVRIQAMAGEHHIPLRQAFDKHDTPDAKYIVVTDSDFPIATARMVPLDRERVRIDRVVVLPEYRRQGIGTMVVNACEVWAEELGHSAAVVESREDEVPFYEQLLYEPCGEAMDGVTLHCVRMEKDL